MIRLNLLLSCIILTLTTHTCLGQLYNFDQNGKKTKLASEKVVVSMTRLPAFSSHFTGVTSLLLSNASSLVGLGVDLVKTSLAKRAESFATMYGATTTLDSIPLGSNSFQPFQLTVRRLTSDQPAKPAHDEAIKITLTAMHQNGEGVFRLKVDSVRFNYSKARITKPLLHPQSGKTIDLNVNVKIRAIYQDNIAVPAPNSSQPSYTLKALDLGESSITIPGLQPGRNFDAAYFPAAENSFYSDWFQLVPAPTVETGVTGIPAQVLNKCWLTITVTVKEANPYGIKATELADFFKDNSTDITTALQGLIPASN